MFLIKAQERVSDQLRTPTVLPPGKAHPMPKRRLGGPRIYPEAFEEETKFLALPEVEGNSCVSSPQPTVCTACADMFGQAVVIYLKCSFCILLQLNI
jgi:hypothetical protein